MNSKTDELRRAAGIDFFIPLRIGIIFNLILIKPYSLLNSTTKKNPLTHHSILKAQKLNLKPTLIVFPYNLPSSFGQIEVGSTYNGKHFLHPTPYMLARNQANFRYHPQAQT